MGQFRPMDYSELLPGRNRHMIRLGHIARWWKLGALCIHCKNLTQLERYELRNHWGERAFMVDLESKLRCRRCGNHRSNKILVIGKETR